jgi:hypothetical protein
MPLPNSKRKLQEIANDDKKEFLQEVVEPEVQTPVEPELLQEIVEEAPTDKRQGKRIRQLIETRRQK